MNKEHRKMEIISSFYNQSFISENKNNIITINLNQSNNCCLYSLKSKDLVCVNYLLFYFSMLLFPSILTLKKS